MLTVGSAALGPLHARMGRYGVAAGS
jgi:hypothetical protein